MHSSEPGTTGFDMPPHVVKADGTERCVGVEIEFAGLTAQAAAAVTATGLGGEVIELNPHAFAVRDTGLGTVTLALDTRFAHPESARALVGEIGARLAPFVGHAVGGFVPTELVTGPVPLSRLAEVDGTIEALRRAGAKGTQDGVLYAFGLHFNPEPVDLRAETLAAVLKAFVVLEPWLRSTAAPNTTRSLLGFADAFPDPYLKVLLAPGYRPDIARLVDDYLAWNPTRSRALDMLPLFAHLDEARVRARLPREKIGSRPTFHYRLPDARVSEAGWSIAPAWNQWVKVERLAQDEARLHRLSAARLDHEGPVEEWAGLMQRHGLR